MAWLDPEAMMARLTPRQLNRWRAWATLIEPAGPVAADARHAELCSAVTRFEIPAERFRHRPPERLTAAAAPAWTDEQVEQVAAAALRRMKGRAR